MLQQINSSNGLHLQYPPHRANRQAGDAKLLAAIAAYDKAAEASNAVTALRRKTEKLVGDAFQWCPHITLSEFSSEWADFCTVYDLDQIAVMVGEKRKELRARLKEKSLGPIIKATLQARIDCLPRVQGNLEAAFRRAEKLHRQHSRATGYNFKVYHRDALVGDAFLQPLTKIRPTTKAGVIALLELAHRYTKNGDGQASGHFLEQMEVAAIIANATTGLRKVRADV